MSVAAVTRTTCAYCGVGCGVVATSSEGTIRIEGDPLHPANAGRLCSKGAALAETLGQRGRLLQPRISARESSWNEALDLVAARLRDTIAEHGPDSVAFYVSGQLLTEDYYVANKLMKGFIGSANIDTNSRLCMSSSVVAHQRAFGEDLVPGCYEDLDEADLIVLVGSNTAWCHPVLFRRIEDVRRRRPQLRIVVIDPRRTPTCELADLHLPLRAGSDVMLFNGLLAWLDREGFGDLDFKLAHTTGAAEAVAVARESAGDAGRVAEACGLDESLVEEFFRLFAGTERVVTAFSQGVNQSSSGSDKATSIINCHLLTGRIGRPGMGPLSLTGQPNAMGGREAGGMATTLAAHMSLENAAHRRIVQSFWKSPRIASQPGLKAVEMFDAVADGRIKALWIIATNPAVSLPDADRVRDAIAGCDFVVVSDCVADTDTTALAHVLLPAAAWGEKDGTTTSSERRISRQRAITRPQGYAKPDWWILCQVAARMGYASAFDYASPREIFDEHARLSAAANHGSRAFDIGGLSGLAAEEYDALEPIRWPVPWRGHDGTARLLGDGGFFHPDRRARIVATPPRAPVHACDTEWPLVLNTGRIRDQWHTMTRTGDCNRLVDHLPEPFADLHADDAAAAGILDGDLVRVTTRWGKVVLRARSSGEMARGSVFVPIHWSDANSSSARVGALVNPAVDPLSGEPEFKHTPAAIERISVAWHGVLFMRDPAACADDAASMIVAAPQGVDWWCRVRGDGFVRFEMAGFTAKPELRGWGRGLVAGHGGILDYVDAGSGIYRAASVTNERLDACLFVAPGDRLPGRDWIASLLAKSRLADGDRMALLAGRPLTGDSDHSPIVCSCFSVRRSKIVDAIVERHCRTTDDIGECLKAGSNCGSCLPELRALLAEKASRRSAA